MIKQSIITIATLGLLSMTASADFNEAGCTGCHGKDFEKSAMNKSKKVNEMTAADIETALTGYKDGSYGGVMKGIMKGQASKMSEDDIKAFAEKHGKAAEGEEETAPVEVNVAGCTGCHGKDFEKSAMGKSKKVNEMSKADIETALTGYKDGSYGGIMKGVMKGQANKLDEAQIKAFADKYGK